MKKWSRIMGLASAVALGAAACDDAGTGPNAIDDDLIRAEAALVAADGMFQDLNFAQDPGLQEFGFLGAGLGPAQVDGMGGQCHRGGMGGSFQCGGMVRDGFTFTRVVTFYGEVVDGDRPVQDGFDPETTDAIHLEVSAEGTRERTYWTATISRWRDMWLTGLLTQEHHLNGTGREEVARSGNPQDGSERTFDMIVDVAWDDVVHLQPRADHPYPESGTITREIFVEVTKDGEVVGGRDVTAVITFNGTRFVTLLVDGQEYEIDLAEREVKRRWGRSGGRG